MNSPESEKAVICSMLLDKSCAGDVMSTLGSKDFYDPRHKALYSAVCQTFTENGTTDIVLVAETLQREKQLRAIGGRAFIAEITETVPTASHAMQYARIVKKNSKLRDLHKAGKKISETDEITEAEEELLKLTKKLMESDQSEQEVSKILEEYLVEENEGIVRGMPTGIQKIDDVVKVGMKGGHFWVIGGYLGTGKTNFALELLRRAAKKDLCFFYSLEMNPKDIIGRILKFERRDFVRDTDAVDSVYNMKLKIMQHKSHIAEIQAHLLSQDVKPKVVIIDFIQNIRTQANSEYESMTIAARELQLLAARTNTCIIALSQVSNDSANNPTKTIGFKGSGAIAAAADIGIELIREKDEVVDEVPFTCWVRKNRHGRPAKIDFSFDRSQNKLIF